MKKQQTKFTETAGDYLTQNPKDLAKSIKNLKTYQQITHVVVRDAQIRKGSKNGRK